MALKPVSGCRLSGWHISGGTHLATFWENTLPCDTGMSFESINPAALKLSFYHHQMERQRLNGPDQ